MSARTNKAAPVSLIGIGGRSWLIGVVGGLAVYQLVKALMWAMDPGGVADLVTGADHEIYYQAALRIRDGGPVYPPFQLAGPYGPESLPELYPPTTVWGLIVPMSFLPAPVWWILPLAIIVGTVIYWWPTLVGWLLILLCLAVERTWVSIAAGNPVMYVAAAVALATRWRWVSILVLLKPTLAPFALWGVRERAWWVGLAAFGLFSVTLWMLPQWFDYATAIRNLQVSDPLYLVDNIPFVLIPLIAYVSRSPDKRLNDAHRLTAGRAGPGGAGGDGPAARVEVREERAVAAR